MEALGEVKVGTPEVVSGLLASLRDEREDARTSAMWALGEVSKDRKSKLPQELSHNVADTLRYMLDDPRNHWSMLIPINIGGRSYTKVVDMIWEALWLVCMRMDEQPG